MDIVKRLGLEERSDAGSPLQLQQLIRRTSRRDTAAFAILYAQTAPKLFGIALRIIGRREEAEEILQEAFVAVWERSADYDAAKGSAMVWLTSILRHCAIDHVRRRAVRPESRGAPEEVLLGLAAAGSTDQGAELGALQRCLGELDEQPRRAVLLAYLYGFTREEIAADFAVPLGTVKTWIRRSVERLKRCLDP
jgi:RNA polymerase sigma-70 factor, ECF subfamily